MRYVKLVVLACLALCLASIHAQPAKTGDSKQVDIVTRQRRSLWTSLVEHIDSIVDEFHGKLLLVDGVNDVDKSGLIMKNKGEDTRPNLIKMVPSNDNSGGLRPDKELLEKQKKEEDLPSTLSDYEFEFEEIVEAFNHTLRVEQEMAKYLLAEIPEWQTDLKTVLVEKGIKNVDSEKLISKIISKSPNLRSPVEYDIKCLRSTHERLRKQIKELIEDFKDQNFLPAKPVKKMLAELHRLDKANNEWLSHKTNLEFKVRKRGQLVRVKVVI